MIRKIDYVALSLLLTVVLAGCDKLDDGDTGLVRQVLPGEWAFSYTIEGDDPGMEFEYKQVIFRADGTCAITYEDGWDVVRDDEGNLVEGDDGEPIYIPVYGSLNGTYQATNAMIRIESSDYDGQERILLWRIVSFAKNRVVAEYDFEYSKGNTTTAVVTLDKQSSF